MTRVILLSILYFLLIQPVIFSQVRINEFSSSNTSRVPDEDGDYNDWLELYNNSSGATDLSGYFLSDDPAFRKKWMLPHVVMEPHSFLFIYASGKNKSSPPISYKTIIPRDADWQYIVPSSDPGNAWKNRGFDAQGWLSGIAGFGFGDNDDSTVLDKIRSVFIRKEFMLKDINSIAEIVLSIDYDDGFVAYINGREVARSNIGTATNVPFNYLTGTAKEAVMFSGGVPENFVIRNTGEFLVEGSNVIAIQCHNNSASSSDLSLIPVVTEGRTSQGITDSIPSYIRLTGRKLHTNFRIDAGGETLLLSAPDSSVVDMTSPVSLAGDLSHGRQPDGASSWFYFDLPTPGAPNNTKSFTAISIDTVLFSPEGGYYNTDLQLTLSSLRGSDSIFYTLDGSEPTVNSILYSGPVTITGNTVVRAKSIKTLLMAGPASTNTYVTKKHYLPVVCISTDPPNLWDYNTGIYVEGPNAEAANPHFGANYWQDWEKRAHFELYDEKGVKRIDQDAGLKIFGAWSRAHAQKSFALFARKEYGKGSFEYRFFKDKPIEKFESIVLRNGGNDWGYALFRDDLTSILVKDMEVDRTAVQPAVVYLNGQYWGILTFREKISDNYIAENHYHDPASVNLLEGNGKIIDGTNASYTGIIDYVTNNTLESDSKFNSVSSKIDINNYIQYQLTEIFVDNRDWPQNNIKYWSTNEPGSKWRWILYDTDFGFSIYDAAAWSFNTFEWATAAASTGKNQPWSTLLFRRMMSNPGFRDEFANQLADRMNRNFTSSRINAVTDSLKSLLSEEIKDHLTRWSRSYNNWIKSIDNIKNFALNRPAAVRSHLITRLGLGVPTDIKVEIATPGTGRVKINSIIPYRFPFTGTYFKDLPIQLTALPSPDYKFVRWESGSVMSNSPGLSYNMEGPQTFRAVFEVARNLDTRIIINEISYDSSPLKDTEDWVEIYNAGKSTVNLKNWVLSDRDPESGFRIESDLVLYPGMYLVICRDQMAFREHWGKTANSTGDFGFGLSSSGDDVFLYDDDGNIVDFVNYSVSSPWPANGAEGGSIELKDPHSDNNDGTNWKASSTGTPGILNTGTKEDQEPVIASTEISCFPNPFSDFSTIRLRVAETARFRIDIFDSMGKKVRTLTDQAIEPGEYYFDWYGEDGGGAQLPAGVYNIRLSAKNFNRSFRLVHVK